MSVKNVAYRYIAYGLRVCSDLPLPELTPSLDVRAPDVHVRLGSVDRRPTIEDPDRGCFYARRGQAYFFWKEDGAYLVRDGREIIFDPVSTADPRLLRLVITGIALGVLLHQRGLLTFHASAVSIHGGAVLFMGEKGFGKSTTAAALHDAGHSMVTDDVAAIDARGRNPIIYPGFPQVKLWPEAAEALGKAPEDMPLVHPRLNKRGHRMEHGFAQAPLPIHCIYVLSGGDSLAAEALDPREACLQLLRNSYALRFIGDAGVTAAHFKRSATLVRKVPVRWLRRKHSLNALGDLSRFVEGDVLGLPPRLPILPTRNGRLDLNGPYEPERLR